MRMRVRVTMRKMRIGVMVVMPGVRQCRAERRAQLIVEQPDADQRHQRPARGLEPGLHVRRGVRDLAQARRLEGM